MDPHPKTPILYCFYHLLLFYFLTVPELSCLAKSYSVSGLTPLPHIPNQLHFIQKSAHEVLDANLEARDRLGVTQNHLFYPIVIESLYLSLLCLFTALSVIHWISKLFIDSIHILFLLYLLLWFGFSTSKSAGFHQNH